MKRHHYARCYNCNGGPRLGHYIACIHVLDAGAPTEFFIPFRADAPTALERNGQILCQTCVTSIPPGGVLPERDIRIVCGACVDANGWNEVEDGISIPLVSPETLN